MTDPTSQRIAGRYRLEDSIGHGGTATVYRAWDEIEQRMVALKQIPVSSELSLPTSLPEWRYPNLVHYFGCGREEDRFWIASEYLQGDSLADVISGQGPLQRGQLVKLCREALIGCSLAHGDGVIHGDLNPANLFLAVPESGPREWKLIDFNLVPQSDFFGSIYTLAPEVFNGVAKSQRSDLYSLGCCFYFAAAGRYPFTGESTHDVMLGHAGGKATPLRQAARGLLPALADWIMWLMACNPKDRPVSASAALALIPC